MSKKITEVVHNEEVELIPVYKVVSKNIREEARFKELNRIKSNGMLEDSSSKEKISKIIKELKKLM